jgi:hypothetical protein
MALFLFTTSRISANYQGNYQSNAGTLRARVSIQTGAAIGGNSHSAHVPLSHSNLPTAGAPQPGCPDNQYSGDASGKVFYLV